MKNQPPIFFRLFVGIAWLALLLGATPSFSASPSRQDWQSAHDFYQSLWKGDFTNIFERIKQDPKIVNQPLWTGDTPILVAAESGHPDVVELLLTNHADINVRGRFGETPLHYAVNKGDAKTAEVLLKYKADINATDDSHIPPIVYSYRNVEVIKVLLAHGADINANVTHNSLLSMALGNHQGVGLGVIEFIVTNGVDVSKCGEDPILDAMFQNDTNVMKLLAPLYLNSTDSQTRGLFRFTLGEAMERNMQEMVRTMLEFPLRHQTNLLQRAILEDDMAGVRSILVTNPAAVNIMDYFDWTPLHLATIKGDLLLAELLTAKQADVDAQDESSNTPLLWASFFGNGPLVDLLLKNKASMNIIGSNGGFSAAPALDLAIRNGYTSIAIQLITNGADLGGHAWWRNTPLHIATEKENVEVMKALLAHGAVVNVKRGANYKQSPLDIAVCGNSPQAVELLISHEASLETQMTTHNGKKNTLFHLWAERGGNTNIAEKLLLAGCNLNATNGEGQTPLHIAIGRWTCSFKPDPATVNPTNGQFSRPIKWIMEDSGREPAVWLLNHQAQVNAKDTNGQTALHLIAKSANTKAIQVLLDHKADINAKDKNGKTPLEVMEDYKIAAYNDRHGFSIPDFKPAEDLLQTNGATGQILTPSRQSGPMIR
jgi:ankyrin repeat protein